tara:strand:+ start:363 stop:938 length:576 start_codon:yes stop_codon:yes gene_type:complete
MKKKFIPSNVMELIFGLGAAVVIIGALLKITHKNFIFDGNDWISAGLITEAIIFAIYGIQNYFDLKDDTVEPTSPIETISVETKELQRAVSDTVKGLNELNSNISQASNATASISVPADMEKNAQNFNEGLSSASSNIKEVADVLANLKTTVAAFESISLPEGLGDEFNKMKSTVQELNAKYEAMLGAMNK